MKLERGDQRRVALLAGCSQGYLSDVINGKRVPTARMATRIVNAATRLGYTVHAIDLLLPEVNDVSTS